MTYQDIVFEVTDGLAKITINRPDNANKLRFQTARELLEAFRSARETADVDVVVLLPHRRPLELRGAEYDGRGQQVLLHRGRARGAEVPRLLQRHAGH